MLLSGGSNGIQQNLKSLSPTLFLLIQTRKQEIADGLPATEKRIRMRDEIKDKNKILFSTANSWCFEFDYLTMQDTRTIWNATCASWNKEKCSEGELLDHMVQRNLAQNIFRITQTEAKWNARILEVILIQGKLISMSARKCGKRCANLAVKCRKIWNLKNISGS